MDSDKGLSRTRAVLEASRRLERTRMVALDRALAEKRRLRATEVARSLAELFDQRGPERSGRPESERGQR
jgi:hypothetical protein